MKQRLLQATHQIRIFTRKYIDPLLRSPHLQRTMQYAYPEVRRDAEIKDQYHGVEVPDPYRWLEDPDAIETKKFVEVQNAITRPYIDAYPYKESIRQKITKMWNYKRCSTPSRHGYKYYQSRNSGLQNQSVIYVMSDLNDDGKIFLDPNLLSTDGTVALVNSRFSQDGRTMAYSVSASGSDWNEIRFKNTATGIDFPEVLKKIKFSSMTWMHDHVGFFYSAYMDQEGKVDGSETKGNEFHKLYFHKLATSQEEDVMVVEFEDPQLIVNGTVSFCGKYLIVTAAKGCKNNMVYFAKLEGDIKQKLELTPVVEELVCDYQYVTNDDSRFIFRTNKGAPNYNLIVINFDEPQADNWQTLVPEEKNDVLDWAKVYNMDKLILCYLRDVKHVLSYHKLETGVKVMDIPLALGTISDVSGKREHDEFFYTFVSFLTPNKTYRVTFEGEQVQQSLYYDTKVGNFDASKFESKQVFYNSKDGTSIPMFLVYKKDFVMDGEAPCLLYAYGGFNINITPAFSVSRLVFIDNFNASIAVANIRGGGEYGDKWHDSGRFAKKQNCFDDFQCAAEYLHAQKYTNPNKLAIMGGSNGGLLIAACINQAPHLFSTAICQVGVLDMLRFHKFTIGYSWKSDYGSSETQDGFEYIYKYSPLHNIKQPDGEAQYPATLLLTADHDDRVVPLHSLKYIAELQHTIGTLQKQTKPLMIRVETKAGHGAGKPTTKLIDEAADILCFIAKSSNMTFRDD